MWFSKTFIVLVKQYLRHPARNKIVRDCRKNYLPIVDENYMSGTISATALLFNSESAQCFALRILHFKKKKKSITWEKIINITVLNSADGMETF